MDHEQALEAMNEYAARNLPYFDISNEHLAGLISAYLGARNAVVMPRELDEGMVNAAIERPAVDYHKHGDLYADIYAALVAECERRDGHCEGAKG